MYAALVVRLLGDSQEHAQERDGWYTTHAFENIKTVLRHKYFSLKDGGIVASQEDCEHLLKREGEQAPARSFHKLRPTKHNMAKGALRPEDAAVRHFEKPSSRAANFRMRRVNRPRDCGQKSTSRRRWPIGTESTTGVATCSRTHSVVRCPRLSSCQSREIGVLHMFLVFYAYLAEGISWCA